MRRLFGSLLLVCAFALPASAGDPHTPGLEDPPPCETCDEGSTMMASGVVWILTSGVWTVFTS